MDAKTIGEIKKQARLYEAAKEKIVSRIQDNVETAIKKLKTAERELLEEVEAELGENPFAELLAEIDSGNPPTDAEVRSVLDKGVLQDFGPSEESFLSLLREIEAFKSWRAKKEEKPSVATPSNVSVESTTQDSITLAWDAVEGASSYQIEVDGGKSLERATKNTFTKKGLLSETKHTFRVRAVRGDSVSEWSDVLKGRTPKKPSPYGGVWKECPGDVDEKRKSSVDKKNPRIVTRIGYDGDECYSTIIGNTPLPLNKVTSWSIKILESRNNGYGINVGVAPSDINQNEKYNHIKCGWYFHCRDSTLWSGPPHNYRGKIYGPRKRNGKYVHTGDSVGVVMDTAKGELSFVVNGVNLGVAYEGIPLDKPLVPCVLLDYEGDSVELVI